MNTLIKKKKKLQVFATSPFVGLLFCTYRSQLALLLALVMTGLYFGVQLLYYPLPQELDWNTVYDHILQLEDPFQKCSEDNISDISVASGPVLLGVHRCLTADEDILEWALAAVTVDHLRQYRPYYHPLSFSISTKIAMFQGALLLTTVFFIAVGLLWPFFVTKKMIVIERYALRLVEWRPGTAADLARLEAEAADLEGNGGGGGGEGDVPQLFVEAEFGNRAAALDRYRKTLLWRWEVGADRILDEPHLKFDIFKKCYPHSFYGRDREGNVVYIEQAGRVDVEGMRRHGLSLDDLLRHYMYNMEYLWGRLSPGKADRMTAVLDLEGVRLRDFAGEVAAFVKSAIGMNSTHYPQRGHKVFIINAPSWFSMVYKAVKPLIPEVTRKKISILDSRFYDEMVKVIDPDQIPQEYGGSGAHAMADSPFEQQYRAFVTAVAKKTGKTLEPFVPVGGGAAGEEGGGR